jgi:malonyl CoA-acyl carrier protein transacylase
MRRETVEQFDRLTRELTEERAAALLRISRTLESLITQLHESRTRLDTEADTDPTVRARELAAYEDLRRQALKYRWYLEVQREALGLHQHHRLDEFYRIPAAIDR